MNTVSVNYSYNYVICFAPEYKFTICKKCINSKRGKEIKMKKNTNIITYNKIISALDRKNENYNEHIYGSVREIMHNGKILARMRSGSIFKNSNKDEFDNLTFVSFLVKFKKNLYKQFRENSYLYGLEIPFDGVSRRKNFDEFSKMENGTFFFNIDLCSAYWQVCHKLGYIDSNLFNEYIKKDSHKAAKRFCISFLARKNKMVYSFGGKKNEISCDIDIFNTIYANIRKELYRLINDIAKQCNFIEYNTDGISVYAHDFGKVKKYFNENGLFYKTTICRKISDSQYIKGNKVVIFKKPINEDNLLDIEMLDTTSELLKKVENFK